MKRKLRRKTKWVICASAIYIVAVVSVLAWGKCFLKPGDEMAYSLLTGYLLLPFIAFGCSGVWGAANLKRKWLVPVTMGLVSLLKPYIVFGTLTPEMFLFGFIPSVVGILMGHAVLTMKRKLANV